MATQAQGRRLGARTSRRRLWPYYVYISTAFTAFAPALAVALPDLLGSGYSPDLVGAVNAVVAAHLLFATVLVLADWGGAIGQFRAIARVQRQQWPWCRPIYAIYGDSERWWRVVVPATFVPAALVYVYFAVAIAR